MRNPNGTFTKGHHWRKPKPHWDREWLAKEYTENGRSASDIAAEVGVKENAVFYWLHKHDIPRRTMKQVRARKHWGSKGEANGMHGRTGGTNPNWRGGVSPERQCVYASHEWGEAVQEVWARDKGRCTECGTENTNRRYMHIHHEKHFDTHPELRCDPENLRLVCAKCHSALHPRVR